MISRIRQWINDFQEADQATKWFIFNWGIYGFIIVAVGIYCYVRLDFVRSYESLPPDSEFTKVNVEPQKPDGR